MCVPTLNTAHRKVILACGVQPSGVYSNDVKCYFALSMAFKNELFLRNTGTFFKITTRANCHFSTP